MRRALLAVPLLALAAAVVSVPAPAFDPNAETGEIINPFGTGSGTPRRERRGSEAGSELLSPFGPGEGGGDVLDPYIAPGELMNPFAEPPRPDATSPDGEPLFLIRGTHAMLFFVNSPYVVRLEREAPAATIRRACPASRDFTFKYYYSWRPDMAGPDWHNTLVQFLQLPGTTALPCPASRVELIGEARARPEGAAERLPYHADSFGAGPRAERGAVLMRVQRPDRSVQCLTPLAWWGMSEAEARAACRTAPCSHGNALYSERR